MTSKIFLKSSEPEILAETFELSVLSRPYKPRNTRPHATTSRKSKGGIKEKGAKAKSNSSHCHWRHIPQKRKTQLVAGCNALHIVKGANPQISPTVLRALVDDILVYVFGFGISIVIHVRLWMLSLHQRLVASWLKIEEILERETAISWDVLLVLKDWIIDVQYLRCHLCER